MNKKNNCNSLIFLTTLSVYLGLVLVGTPPILAQAALTQKIEVRNEAEIKDDLDKKPDDEKALSIYASTLENLLILAKDFSSKNAEKLGNNAYEFDCVYNVTTSGRGTTCKGTTGTGGSGLFTSDFIPSFEQLHKVFPHSSEKDIPQVRINLILSGEEFSLKTTFTQDLNDQAARYQNFYDAGLLRIKLLRSDSPQITTFSNTSISFENNQVFIVTRLPRASIDELLAKKDAQ